MVNLYSSLQYPNHLFQLNLTNSTKRNDHKPFKLNNLALGYTKPELSSHLILMVAKTLALMVIFYTSGLYYKINDVVFTSLYRAK